jgi:hypothetical protein
MVSVWVREGFKGVLEGGRVGVCIRAVMFIGREM